MALHTLAERRGRDLAAEGIDVVAMGGITNTRAFASHYGPRGLGVPLAGLYDAPEEAKVRHGLAAAGLGAALEPDGLTRLGFYQCSADLEDESSSGRWVSRPSKPSSKPRVRHDRGCWRACPPNAAGRARR